MGRNTDIIKELRAFRERANKELAIKKVIFFGSRAVGKAKRHSDIDLIVVSPKFKKLNFFQRGARMYAYWDLNCPVDFLCYTPEEFDKLKSGATMVRTAIRKGIEI